MSSDTNIIPIFVEKEDIFHRLQVINISYDRVDIKLSLKQYVSETTMYCIHMHECDKIDQQCLGKIIISQNEKDGQTFINPWTAKIRKTVIISSYSSDHKDRISNNVKITRPNKWMSHQTPRSISLSTVKAIEMNDPTDENIYVHFDFPSTHFMAEQPGVVWVIGHDARGEFGLDYAGDILCLTRCGWSVDKNIINISSGERYCIYRSEYGEYYSCGFNTSGQCALNHKNDTKIVEKIEFFEKNGNIVRDHFVDTNSSNMFWVCESGTMYGNGWNEKGVLDADDKSNKCKPMEIKYFNEKGMNVISVISADQYSIALCDDGSVYTSGCSKEQGLGHGYIGNKAITKWKQVESLRDYTIIQAAAGLDFSLFVDNTGNVWTCGNNLYGQLGLGNHTEYTINIPNKIEYFEKNNIKIIRVDAGYRNVLAVAEDGKIYAWGSNQFGQCGDGTFINHNTPQIIRKLVDEIIIDVKCGDVHCAAITNKNHVYMW
eukprot:238170_1